MTHVTVEHVYKTYPGPRPVRALADIDLDVASGTTLAILGQSGCGKTTLLRVIAGFERADTGILRFDRHVVADDAHHLPPERRSIGIVPQEGGLFPHLDVAANIAFGLRRLDRYERRRRVDEMLELVTLQGYGPRRPHQLSGGQQQRVALARALAPRPAIMLLDEPFAALDTSLRASLRADVSEVLRVAKATTIFVTHDQIEALTMADRVAVMRHGQIVQTGTPLDIYRQPIDVAVAALVGEYITLDGIVSGDSVETRLGRHEIGNRHHAGDLVEVTVMIRPEQISTTPDAATIATVTRVSFEGASAQIDLAIDDVTLTARWPATTLPTLADRLPIAIQGPVTIYRRPNPDQTDPG
ncbi:MAG TPA: ABC transporter ATP-binding protein [Ilumatobacter sp.]|nr:ABC transporter ATP-binding protein [Ilumatobacter sp.]